MKLKIVQKYFTVNNKFALTDENDRAAYYAEEILFKRANLYLYDSTANGLIYKLEANFKHLFSFFDVMNEAGENIGFIREKAHMPGFMRGTAQIGNVGLKIKAGPIHMKAFVLDEKGKPNKKTPAVRSKKKLMRIADTYVADINTTVIPPSVGAVVALWYDKMLHGKQH